MLIYWFPVNRFLPNLLILVQNLTKAIGYSAGPRQAHCQGCGAQRLCQAARRSSIAFVAESNPQVR